MIAEYAPRVVPYLPIALGLLVAGLGLKVIGRRVVESKFLTAPWLIILALVAAVAARAPPSRYRSASFLYFARR